MSLEELEKLGGFESVMAGLPPALRADKVEIATLQSFTRKLPREGVVRRTAARILGETAGPPEAVPALIQATVQRSGFRWRERIVAAWCLGLTEMRDSQRSAVLEALGVLANHSLERDNTGAFLRLQYRALFITIPFTILTGGLMNLFQELSPLHLLQTALFNFLVSIFVLPFSTMLERRRMNLARAAAVLSLGRMSAPEATGVVAAAIYDKVGEGSSEVKKAAERALPSVLGALRPDHYGQVRRNSIDYLCRILQDKRNYLVIAALEALEKVGGGSAVDPVARVAKKSRIPDVRALAGRILPVLESRRRDEQAPSLLLRATSLGEVDEAVLLRPFEQKEAIDPSLLLRPTIGEVESK